MDSKTAKAYRLLKNSGVEVQKRNQIRFNPGSETYLHSTAKAVVGRLALDHDYRVSSEVGVDSGDIDLVLWGHPKRLSYAVEIETSPTEAVKDSKADRYVSQTAINDLIMINASELSLNILEMKEQIQDELGL